MQKIFKILSKHSWFEQERVEATEAANQETNEKSINPVKKFPLAFQT